MKNFIELTAIEENGENSSPVAIRCSTIVEVRPAGAGCAFVSTNVYFADSEEAMNVCYKVNESYPTVMARIEACEAE